MSECNYFKLLCKLFLNIGVYLLDFIIIDYYFVIVNGNKYFLIIIFEMFVVLIYKVWFILVVEWSFYVVKYWLVCFIVLVNYV